MIKLLISFLTLLVLTSGAVAVLAPESRAATVVDLELQLLVDTSSSVSSQEFALQRSGYAAAFRDRSIQNAILRKTGGRLGRIAVELVYWSGATQQKVAVGWTLLNSVSSINTFANRVGAAPRAFSGSTAPDAAINFGAPRLFTNTFDGRKQIMDVSGDGTGWRSRTSAARDAALGRGVDQINGVAIGRTNILEFYEDNIIGGKGSFAVLAATFDDVGAAVANNVGAEVGARPSGAATLAPVPLPASALLLLAALLLGASAARSQRRGVRARMEPARGQAPRAA